MARISKLQAHRIEVLQKVSQGIKPSDYLEFSQFLSQLYRETKKELDHYSYKEFSLDLGLGLGNSSWLFIKCKRWPAESSLARVSKALGLPQGERMALNLIAAYEKNNDPSQKESIIKDLIKIKKLCLDDNLAQMELEFYSEWHHAIIFEMVGLKNFSSEPSWIVANLNAMISEDQVRLSLEILEQLGCIRLDPTLGRHVKVVKDFESKNEVPGIGIIRFHQKMIDLGKESIHRVHYEKREVGAVTVAISSEGVSAIKSAIVSFREYLMFLSQKFSDNADTILQVNLQMFPIVDSCNTEKLDSTEGEDIQ